MMKPSTTKSPKSPMTSPTVGKIPIRAGSTAITKTPLRPVQRGVVNTGGNTAANNSRGSSSPPSENADAGLLAEKAERLNNRLKHVEEQCQVKDRELKTLKTEVTKLKEDKIKSQNEKTALSKQNSKLQADLQKKVELEKSKDNDFKEASNKKKISELEEQLNKIKKKCEEIKSEKEQQKQIMQKEINTLKSEMSQLEQNYTSKLENLETRRAKDIQSAKGETAKVLEKREKELFALKEEHKKQKEEKRAVDDLVKKAEEKVAAERDAIIGDLERRIAELEAESDTLRGEAEHREREAEEVKQRFLNEINAISDSVENELQVKDNRIKDLEDELDDLQNEWEEHKKQQDDVMQGVKSRSDQMLQVRDKQISDQKEEIQRLLESVQKTKKDNAILSEEINQLKKQMSKMKKDRDVLASENEKERFDLEQELNQKFDESQKYYKDRFEKLQQQIKAHEAELIKARNQGKALKSENVDLHQQITELKKGKERAEKELQTSFVEETEIEVASNQKELQAEVDQTEIFNLKAMNQEMVEKLKKREAEMKKTEDDFFHLQEVVKSLRQENDDLVQDNSNFIQKVKEKDDELRLFLEGKNKETDRLIELERENAAFPVKLQEMEFKYNQMCSNSEELAKRVNGLESEIEKRDDRIFQLEDEIRRQAYTNNTKDMYLSNLESTANQVRVEILNLAKRVANISAVVQQMNAAKSQNQTRIRDLERENAHLQSRLKSRASFTASTPSSRFSRQNNLDGNLSASSPSLTMSGVQPGQGQKVKFIDEVIVDPRDSKRVTDFQNWSRQIAEKLRKPVTRSNSLMNFNPYFSNNMTNPMF